MLYVEFLLLLAGVKKKLNFFYETENRHELASVANSQEKKNTFTEGETRVDFRFRLSYLHFIYFIPASKSTSCFVCIWTAKFGSVLIAKFFPFDKWHLNKYHVLKDTAPWTVNTNGRNRFIRSQ